MTGFGHKTMVLPIGKSKKVAFSIEIKSVNSRSFEVVCKLPSFLNALEIDIVKSLKKKLLRGRIYVGVRVAEDQDVLGEVIPSLGLLKEYIKALNIIKKTSKISGTLTFRDLLHIPDLFVYKIGDIGSIIEKPFLSAVNQISDQLVKSRTVEGKVLQKDLEQRFAVCIKESAKVKTIFEKVIKAKKGEIKKTLELQEKGDEQAKLKLDELYSTLNKIDIHEELVRFESHIKNVIKVLKDSSKEKGKRIDFILQELLRESNTMLAKCSNFDISAHVVNVKVELEKAREQTQNIV
jgi:uncharacterized protein (TIGR00255 family)